MSSTATKVAVPLRVVVSQRMIQDSLRFKRKTEGSCERYQEQMKKVFVTYAWGTQEENERVYSFVNMLRENGYDATCDQKQSA